ncbi:hypothetical protein FWF89_03005 [Candidatus Saccharibacteria bacterium]|nr:hypothetical protein [Candidatus Saccharibacteria bacterium]
MKRIRLIVAIATVILLVLMVVGIVLLIINQRLDFLDTSYEIIAFCIGIAGMLFSIISQIDAYRQDRIISQMKNNITKLAKESDTQIRADNYIKRQLNEIEEDISKKPKHK